MKTVIDQPVNKLPVLTYRWLKLNQYNLQEPIAVPLKSYTKPFVNLEAAGKHVEITAAPPAVRELGLDAGVSSQLTQLSQTTANTGIQIMVPMNQAVETPVEIAYHLDHENSSVIESNQITAEENSQITLVFDYTSEPGAAVFHNGFTHITAKSGSVVNIVKIQRMEDQALHFDAVTADIDPHAQVNLIQAELGSQLAVTNYAANLQEGADVNIKSLYFGDQERVIDVSFQMNHIGRRSTSRLTARGVLKDCARKAFKGTLDFKKGASRAEGSEDEYVLLLDPTVKSDSVPLLLCGEEDVKGEHAASCGKFDPDQLFYLMSRGFDKTEASRLIVEAVFNPVIDEIPIQTLKAAVSEVIQRRLAGD
ncbi:MAG: Fe-S cluster assembly protein SufD [Candidatus Wallacebacter cryptica]|nr:Fe-S cluster assembly protein SufD [Bacillota bacterium]